MRTLIAVLVASSVGHSLAAQSARVQRELFAARDTIWHAWFANDAALLRRYLPPAAATVEGAASDLRWNDRAQIVQGSRGFAQSKGRLVDLKFANSEIAQSGQSALVRSNYMTVVESNGRRDTTRGRATELFVRIGNSWVNPYWQLEPEAHPNDVGREILLPDTLGANFAIGDSISKSGTLADYDALLGTWQFRFQTRNPGGGFNPSFTGHWTFAKNPGGALVEDRWRPDDPSIPMAISLYTYRVFDDQRKVWQMIGTHSYGGEIQPGLTWSDGTNRYAIQRAHGILTRIRYFSIDADHFLWRSDRSNDGGKTWIRDAGTMEATRIGK